MTQGRITKQLSETGPISGKVIAVSPWKDGACNLVENGADINGNIVLIKKGDCMKPNFEKKFVVLLLIKFSFRLFPRQNNECAEEWSSGSDNRE